MIPQLKFPFTCRYSLLNWNTLDEIFFLSFSKYISWWKGFNFWCVTVQFLYNGRIRLSVSTVNRTYELSGITHVTSFRKYGKHLSGPSTYGSWLRTYSKLFSCKSVLTVCSYRAQSNEIHTYGRVSHGSIPRVRRYGLLYLRTVEYDQCFSGRWVPLVRITISRNDFALISGTMITMFSEAMWLP